MQKEKQKHENWWPEKETKNTKNKNVNENKTLTQKSVGTERKKIIL